MLRNSKRNIKLKREVGKKTSCICKLAHFFLFQSILPGNMLLHRKPCRSTLPLHSKKRNTEQRAPSTMSINILKTVIVGYSIF